jgi:hypothetical protein
MSSLEEQVDKANAARVALRDSVPQKTPDGPPSQTAQLFGAIYFRGVAADLSRSQRWAAIAHQIMGDADDPHIGFQLQQCAQLDSLLVAFESENRTNPGPNPGNLYIAGASFEFSIGDSWLLFTYEVLRTFRWSARFKSLPEEQRTSFEKIFRLIHLARIPLAKHQAAGTLNRKTGAFVFHAPIHILHDGLGTAGWRVFDKASGELTDILRRPLSEALLQWGEGTLSNEALTMIQTKGSRELIRIIKT